MHYLYKVMNISNNKRSINLLCDSCHFLLREIRMNINLYAVVDLCSILTTIQLVVVDKINICGTQFQRRKR